MAPPQYTFSHPVQRQIRSETEKEISQSLGQLMVATVSIATITSLSLSCIAQVGLKRLIDSFKNLQIIVHIMLIDLFSVAHCEIFFGYLLNISNLQVYDPSETMTDALPVD